MLNRMIAPKFFASLFLTRNWMPLHSLCCGHAARFFSAKSPFSAAELESSLRRQARVATKMRAALDTAIREELLGGVLLDSLFCIKDIHLSSNFRNATIVWSCKPEQRRQVEYALRNGRFQIARAAAASIRIIPALSFVHVSQVMSPPGSSMVDLPGRRDGRGRATSTRVSRPRKEFNRELFLAQLRDHLEKKGEDDFLFDPETGKQLTLQEWRQLQAEEELDPAAEVWKRRRTKQQQQQQPKPKQRRDSLWQPRPSKPWISETGTRP